MNEDALERERKNCEALRRRLSNMEAQAAQGSALEPAFAEAKNRLKDAEAEVARLQNALNKVKQQRQVNLFSSLFSCVNSFQGHPFLLRGSIMPL